MSEQSFVIHKVPLPMHGRVRIQMVAGIEPISVGSQNCCPVMWYRVPASSIESDPTEWWSIVTVFTGDAVTLDEGHQFVGTTQGDNGLVFHIYAKKVS